MVRTPLREREADAELHRRFLRRALWVCAFLHWFVFLPGLYIGHFALLPWWDGLGAKSPGVTEALIRHAPWGWAAAFLAADLLWTRFHGFRSVFAALLGWLWIWFHLAIPGWTLAALAGPLVPTCRGAIE